MVILGIFQIAWIVPCDGASQKLELSSVPSILFQTSPCDDFLVYLVLLYKEENRISIKTYWI